MKWEHPGIKKPLGFHDKARDHPCVVRWPKPGRRLVGDFLADDIGVRGTNAAAGQDQI